MRILGQLGLADLNSEQRRLKAKRLVLDMLTNLKRINDGTNVSG